MDLKDYIRDIPNFPTEGILFRDITTLLKSPKAFNETIDRLTAHARGMKVDVVVGIESRGFIFGAPLALRLGCAFVPVRKLGKLPAETVVEEYRLEYGVDKLEIHVDAIPDGAKTLIVDDLLATGGTASATVNLVKKVGGVVASCAFVIELDDLKGREKLSGVDVFSIIHY